MSVSLSLKELRVERKIKNSNSNFNFRPVNFARLEIISSKIEPLPFLFLLQTSKRFRFHFFSTRVKKVKEAREYILMISIYTLLQIKRELPDFHTL